MFSNPFRSQTTTKLFNDGVKLYRNGEAEKAVEKLSEAIKKESTSSDPDKVLLSNVHCIRGEVYLSVGVAILSQSDFTYALQYNPNNASALNNLAIWHSIKQFATPDYIKSFEYFDKAIVIRPDRRDFQMNKACIKIQSGDKSGCDDLRNLESEDFPDAKMALEKFCSKNP